MPEIDPDRPPLSADELQRDALATGADPDAPPLVEAESAHAGDTSAEGGDPEAAIETALTRLPPG